MNRAARITLAVLLLLLPATALFAQKKGDSTTRSVRGVVTDASDTPVTGAVVQLENLKTQQIRSWTGTAIWVAATGSSLNS